MTCERRRGSAVSWALIQVGYAGKKPFPQWLLWRTPGTNTAPSRPLLSRSRPALQAEYSAPIMGHRECPRSWPVPTSQGLSPRCPHADSEGAAASPTRWSPLGTTGQAPVPSCRTESMGPLGTGAAQGCKEDVAPKAGSPWARHAPWGLIFLSVSHHLAELW